MKIILISLMVITIAHAQVNSGDVIKALNYNGSSHQIGDVKTSLLDESSFSSIHGDCWKLYNTTNSTVDLTNTDLAAHLGNSIPSASGRVLRAKGGQSETVIGAIQNFATSASGLGGSTNNTGAHFHYDGISGVAHDSDYYYFGTASGAPTKSRYSGSSGTNSEKYTKTSTSGNHSHTLNITSSATETRMNNVTVNMYIKVNKECNSIP